MTAVCTVCVEMVLAFGINTHISFVKVVLLRLYGDVPQTTTENDLGQEAAGRHIGLSSERLRLMKGCAELDVVEETPLDQEISSSSVQREQLDSARSFTCTTECLRCRSVRDLRACWQDYRIDEAVSQTQMDTFRRW